MAIVSFMCAFSFSVVHALILCTIAAELRFVFGVTDEATALLLEQCAYVVAVYVITGENPFTVYFRSRMEPHMSV